MRLPTIHARHQGADTLSFRAAAAEIQEHLAEKRAEVGVAIGYSVPILHLYCAITVVLSQSSDSSDEVGAVPWGVGTWLC